MERCKTWAEIYQQLSVAEQKGTLDIPEQESLATAAYLVGKDAEYFKIMEQVHQDYLGQKNTRQAVRCAFWLGMMCMTRGEHARGNGWIARAERMLNQEESDCAEKGLFLLPVAKGNLSGGHSVKAQMLFAQAVKIGERFSDLDLIALARLGEGQAMIFQGNTVQGLKLLDEVMVAIETEKIIPVARGIIYCAVIETCRKVWDLSRAREWTSVLSRWCDSQPGLVPFRGQCAVRRAEIMQFHGEWPRALVEIQDACRLLSSPPGEPAAGEAYYRKAELHRLLGNFKEAEDAYRDAARWGRKPQPGLALLRLAQGQDDAAETSIGNTLQETKDTKKLAELLPAAVKIMIAAKQIEEAAEATKKLSGIAREFDAPYLHAMSAYCRGAVLLMEGNVQPAMEHLQKALKLWDVLHLPYESAYTRELKGLVYRELNDKDNSEAELTAAKWLFGQLGAIPDLERINRLVHKKRRHQTHGLTLREIQILRLVASGKTNKSVACELFISERTVDRHVSNIFSKLGVSSRVAAVTSALKNKIFNVV